MAIKEIVKLIEYFIKTIGQSPVYEQLIQVKNGK